MEPDITVMPTAVLVEPSQQRPTLNRTRGRSERVMMPKQKSYKLRNDDIQALQQQGFPRGLAQTLSTNNVAFPLRIWVVDNSGSMNQRDGHRIVSVDQTNRKLKLVDCTRWAEIQQTVEYHSQMAAHLHAPTVFRMLNDPGQGVPQQFSIGERGEQLIDEDLTIALQSIGNSSPGGVTPLTEHIREIRANIVSMEPSLRENGSKVAIILATDGLPSDNKGYCNERTKHEFSQALRTLQGLPVWVVVRLCTDDDDVVEFYNQLDENLELSLEVLDDFTQEALEVTTCNKWLNYGLPLHRCRELGYYNRLFDLLDERQLSPDELRDFLMLLFGSDNFDGVPDPQADWKGFLKCITNIVEKEEKQWDPVKKKMAPWVDLKKIDKAYRPKRGLFGF
jgi:Mg-chelatase subunit ChlD